MEPLVVRDLGRMRYDEAFDEQRRVHADVVAGAPSQLLLVEHEPVVTISKRPEARQHLVAGEALLARHGVEVCATDRGGDITYHGPGQIVAYPIIDLRPRNLNLRQYVWLLEQTIIDTVAKFGITAHRDDCAVGVWVDLIEAKIAKPQAACGVGGSAKIAAIGVRGSRWVTMHGLALNVKPNMEHFKLIVPCGLVGRPVTSMHEQLGERCPTLDAVKATLIEQLQTHLTADRRPAPANLPAR